MQLQRPDNETTRSAWTPRATAMAYLLALYARVQILHTCLLLLKFPISDMLTKVYNYGVCACEYVRSVHVATIRGV